MIECQHTVGWYHVHDRVVPDYEKAGCINKPKKCSTISPISSDMIGAIYLVIPESGHIVIFILHSFSMHSWNESYCPYMWVWSSTKMLWVKALVDKFVICSSVMADREDFDFAVTNMLKETIIAYIDIAVELWSLASSKASVFHWTPYRTPEVQYMWLGSYNCWFLLLGPWFGWHTPQNIVSCSIIK